MRSEEVSQFYHMGQVLIVANWKSNKTSVEAKAYLSDFTKNYEAKGNAEVIICPSFTSLQAVSEFVLSNGIDVKIGAQNISPFTDGAYTGEISAKQASEFASYVIIGHSERRENFGESDELLSRKVELALSTGLVPIFCIQNENTFVPESVKIVAYEPIEAIGTGNPDTPEDTQKVATQVKSKNPQVEHVLYGGSVTSENVRVFLDKPDIAGVLVGGASLDPIEFSSIIKQC